MQRTEADITVKKLLSGFWHVRFGPQRFVQWPEGTMPAASNTFGFSTEDKEDAARRAAQAVDARNLLTPRGITTTPNCIGGQVVYRTAPDYDAEEGVITSYNDDCVFVRYGDDVNSKATSRRDLDWL